MVKIISQYDVLVQTVHVSEEYQNATEKRKQEIDRWLKRGDVIEYFNSRFLSQFTLHESFSLGFVNSSALRNRTSEEQNKVMGYLNSKNFKGFADRLDRIADGLFRI